MGRKPSTLLTLLLVLVCATYAAAEGNPSAGLDAACKKAPDPDFCELFLQPCASDFSAGNDPKKMGFVAINATLGKVQASKAFILRLSVEKQAKKDARAAIMLCVGKFGRSEGNLKMAARELNYTNGAAADVDVLRKPNRADPIKMIDDATTELSACVDALKKSGEAGKTDGEGKTDAEVDGGDVTLVALRQAIDSVLACGVAKAFIPNSKVARGKI
ncbi:hypothetical protein C2S51_033737 [Perilla frutescens var. frutescens]|nr:hypothetical protein C2S51_033737 [Perilla frutescens var. frutescens]